MNVAAEYVFSRHITIKSKEEYEEEIFRTIKNCVASFSFDKGDNFVHYLKAGMNYRRASPAVSDFSMKNLSIDRKFIILALV
jgi:hypothetical protein